MKKLVYVCFLVILVLSLVYFFYETNDQKELRFKNNISEYIYQIELYNNVYPRKKLISIPVYYTLNKTNLLEEQLKKNVERYYPINSSLLETIYKAYQNGEEVIIIINDNMYLDMTNIIDHTIEDIVKNTPDGWDVLQLYSTYKNSTILKKIGIHSYHYTESNLESDIAYVINRKGMEKWFKKIDLVSYCIQPSIMIPIFNDENEKYETKDFELQYKILDQYKSKLYSIEKKKKLKDLISNLESYNERVGFTCDIPCPVYYINMDKDMNRRLFMERQIVKLPNVDFTRIPGFNGYKIQNKQHDVVDGVEFINKFSDMSKSEIGCTMSHLIAIKKAYMNGDEIAMICEDDILFDTCTLIKPIQEMIDNAPKNWEILQLSSFVSKEVHQNSKEHPDIEYIRNIGNNSNTACYLINKNGMERLLKMTNSLYDTNFFVINKKLGFPSKGVADIFIYQICLTFTILPVPFTVDNTDNDSTIHTDHTNDHLLYSINTLSKFPEIKDKDFTFIIDENDSETILSSLLNVNDKKWKVMLLCDEQVDIVDERIKVLKKNNKNIIKLCDTKWIIIMNKEDLLLPTFMETLKEDEKNLKDTDTDVIILTSLKNENVSLCIKKECMIRYNLFNYSNEEILNKLESNNKIIKKSKKISYISSILKQSKIKQNSTILNLIIYNEKIDYEVDMKKIIEKYLKKFNFVTFYFICYRENQFEYIEIENNCIYINGKDDFLPQILDKTIIATEYCVNVLKINFDYLIRSNISTLLNFNFFPELPKLNIYTGPHILHLTWTDPKYGITTQKLNNIYGTDYVMGTCIILSKDMVNFLLKNKSKLDRTVIDDLAIGILFKDKITFHKFSQSENNIDIYSFYTRNKTSDNRYKDVERMQIILDISVTIDNFTKVYENLNIPKVIFMCDKKLDQIKIYSKNWEKLNPDYKVSLYDDDMCKKMLSSNYPSLYLDIFNYLKDGPIKADFWRLCVLYLYGGVYVDADIEPLIPIKDFLEVNANFVIVSTYEKEYKFNPNFIMCKKNDKIIKDCIDWYINKYNNKEPYEYWKWSIVNAFNDTFHFKNFNKNFGLYNDTNKKIQILQQVKNKYKKDDYVIYNNILVFNDRYKNYDSVNHAFITEL
jgi:GR25 family glycosyltransferase involved in LPS biosynthesis